MQNAQYTESNRRRRGEAASSAAKHVPAWLKVARKWKRADMLWAEFYRKMGWGETAAYQFRRFGRNIRLSQAAQMATALGAPVGRFLEDVAREQGIPPLYQRVILKPTAYEKSHSGRRKCSRCGGFGHNTRTCKVVVSPLFTMMQEKAKKSPVRRRPARAKKGRE